MTADEELAELRRQMDTAGFLAQCARRLERWERHHRHAARQARSDEMWFRRGKTVKVYGYMPETTMRGEYMPGRLPLLEAADPNDGAAVHRYKDAAFGGLRYQGPAMCMPRWAGELWVQHDDVRVRWERANRKAG